MKTRRLLPVSVSVCFGLSAVLCLATLALPAQGARGERGGASAASRVYRQPVNANWLPGNTNFWYRNELPGGRCEFVFVDAVKGERKPAFDHAQIAAALAKATDRPVAADRLPIDRLIFSNGGSELSLSSGGKWWRWEPKTASLKEEQRPEKPVTELPAAEAARASTRTGSETQITFLNQTKEDVEVFWINTDGERVRYATIPPGGQHAQHTFAGHVWIATDKAGKTLGVFEATESASNAVLGRATRP
jgi:dipeptidyl-peptidase 4